MCFIHGIVCIKINIVCVDAEIGHVLPANVQATVRESLQTCVVEHQQQKLVESIGSKLLVVS